MFRVEELVQATRAKLIQGQRCAFVKGISIDSRALQPGEAFLAIRGNNFDGHDFIDEAMRKGAACIISNKRQTISPNSQIIFLQVQDTAKALGDIARFQRQKFDLPVIAVTGSNGKTTTKEMIAWLLSADFKVLKNLGTKNNHIGLPLTLLGINSSYDLAVVEIGTNHFGEVGYLAGIAQPNIAVITNIGPSHLEYFKDLNGVFKEKGTLLKYLKNPHIAVLNADDNLLKRKISLKKKPPIVFSFGIKNPGDFSAARVNLLNGKLTFRLKKYSFTLNTPGVYNIYNALAAIAVARLLGVSYSLIKKRLAAFEFPRSRLKFLELFNTKIIDDTYNSNPASVKQALEALGHLRTRGRKIFVMGDMLELGGSKELFHRRAGAMVKDACDCLIAVGELSYLTAAAAGACGFDTRNIFTCASAQQAREILFKKISPGPDDVVLVKGSRSMKMEEVFS